MSLELARKIWLRQGRKRCPVEQSTDTWTGDFVLPDAVAEYYRDVGPDELYCYEETDLRLYLPSLRRLENFQLGIFESIPPPGCIEPLMPRDWGPHKLALAIHHTYPFIFESETGQVSLNTPGVNRDSGWQPVAMLSSIADMMIFFGLLEEAISQVDHHDHELDDQSPDFIPFLIEAASLHIDHNVASILVRTMYR